jgi:hypothetical protein
MEYIFVLTDLEADVNLANENIVSRIHDQLNAYGRMGPDHNRYKVAVDLIQGLPAPAKALNEYIKPVIESITKSNLFWIDNEQIDEITIRRVRNPRLDKSKIRVQIRKT